MFSKSKMFVMAMATQCVCNDKYKAELYSLLLV